jgi:FimV-like protein
MKLRAFLVLLHVVVGFASLSGKVLAQETAAAPAKEDAVKKGPYEATFTERSPLSAVSELTKRLGKEGMETDYDLGKTSFWVCVPENYDPAKKYGLLVLDNYKQSIEPPTPVLPQFAELNLIFVTPRMQGAAGAERCGLLLDAVYNLKKQYSVDAGRVYLVACDTEYCGERLALSFPDVFTGAMFLEQYRYFQKLKSANGGFYEAKLPPPDPRHFTLAKARPIVLASRTDDEYIALMYKAFQKEFKSVKKITLTMEQYHYPNYMTDWIPQVIKFFDEHQTQAPVAGAEQVKEPAAAAAPATAPTAAAKPAADPAPGLLSLAKSYIASGKFEQARSRLNTIIEKHAESPAAKEAKTLLDEIKGK